ncbi:MAG: hypothetical protein MI919_05250, partial [Holophagales bacterium]|nr:hypothetical protein [Holophagales bacterium]
MSETQIVFALGNDLWIVDRSGGSARPLATPAGRESSPRFSPDGREVAFVAEYDGAADIYRVAAAGGTPVRLTHHPVREVLTDWSDPGGMVFFGRGVVEYPKAQELFLLDPEGGLPRKLPVPYGAMGSISPDGRHLAYVPHSRDDRHWKRYVGGMASDIWLFDLDGGSSSRITDWPGTDSIPMWHGDRLYYLSDRGPEHRLAIWVLDLGTLEHRQVTYHQRFDVKWPSIGGQAIVYQLGSELRLLDLDSHRSHRVCVEIPGDRAALRPQPKRVGAQITAARPSPSGARVLAEARGDIWSIPARDGSARNLTATSGIAER